MIPQATAEQVYRALGNLETFRPILENAANNPMVKQKLEEAGQDPAQLEKLKEVYPNSFDRPNIISYSDSGILYFHGKSASYCSGKHRKLYLEEQLKLARLGTLRYWSSEFNRLKKENN